MYDLAIDLSAQDDVNAAEALTRTTYEAQLSVLGIDHPNTLSSLCSLAIRLKHLGVWWESVRELLSKACTVCAPCTDARVYHRGDCQLEVCRVVCVFVCMCVYVCVC